MWGCAVDDAVALVVAAPVIALALWAVAFVGGHSNSQARAAVAAELAARAAADSGAEAADTARRTALGATWPPAPTPTPLSSTTTPAGRPR